MEAEIAHRRDDQSPAEFIAFKEVAREEDHEVITVADLSSRVNRDETIGVAVEGEAEISVQIEYLGYEVFDMRRAAVLIDVATIRLVVNRRDPRAGRFKDLVRDVTGRSVRAVEHDMELS